jgi:methyl-accepting chemotaxis protein
MAASSEEESASETTISTSIQQVAAEAERGAESVLEASKVLLELSSLIQIAKTKGTSAATNSQVTMEAAVMGKETVNETVSRMLHIKDKTIETENLIANLSKYSNQIGLITDTITSIASQTNLLALNAAIEAARAGEAGRGFAVVAEEVRQLAEQSNHGAGEVAALVREVAAGTAAAVSATQQSRVEVEEGVKSVNEAGQALEHILSAVESTVRDVNGIVEVTNEETATSEKVVNLINTLATVVENTAAHIQQVAASTEQTTAAMETIAASAEQTNSMANELEAEVEHFTV